MTRRREDALIGLLFCLCLAACVGVVLWALDEAGAAARSRQRGLERRVEALEQRVEVLEDEVTELVRPELERLRGDR